MDFISKGKQSLKRDSSGQGALEYLLIISGAILVAAIVIAILVNTSSSGNTGVSDQSGNYDSVLGSGENLLDDIQNNNCDPECAAGEECVSGVCQTIEE